MLCLLVLSGGAAVAQERSVSYSTWIVSGNMITLRFLLPVAQAQRLLGVAVPVLTTGKLEEYLLQHLSVQSAGGECPAIDQGFDLGRVDPLAVGPDLYGFEIFFRCADPRNLVLRNSALFERIPAHVNLARIQMRGRSVEQIFTGQHRELALPESGAIAAAGLGSYLRLGFLHVISTADRWCLLLGLLLLVRRRRELGYLMLALVCGYLVSTLASVSDRVLPRTSLVEAFVGLLIALLGALITQRETRNPRVAIAWPGLLLLLAIVFALLRAPWAALALLGGSALSAGFLMLSRDFEARATLWPFLVAVFAFLDGFGLAAALPPAQLPEATQLRILFGFNLGALLFETLFVALGIGGWLLLRARRLQIPRGLLNDVGAAGLCGLGSFWMLSRL